MSARTLAVTVLLAVCVATGTVSGAGAAALVTGADVVDGSLTGRDVRDGGLGTAEVKDGGLTTADFPFAQRGPRGLPGDTGPRGRPAVDQPHFAATQLVTVPPGEVRLALATCDPGYVALAGGVHTRAGSPGHLLDTAPLGTSPLERRSWAGRLRNPNRFPIEMITWAVCAEVRP